MSVKERSDSGGGGDVAVVAMTVYHDNDSVAVVVMVVWLSRERGEIYFEKKNCFFYILGYGRRAIFFNNGVFIHKP